MSQTTHRVAYRLTSAPAPGPTVISRRRGPVAHPSGIWVVTIDLGNARSRGMDDLDAATRIVAIAHPGTVTPEQVEIVELLDLTAA